MAKTILIISPRPRGHVSQKHEKLDCSAGELFSYGEEDGRIPAELDTGERFAVHGELDERVQDALVQIPHLHM